MTAVAADKPRRCEVRRTPEILAQARSGLMGVNGRDDARPRRLGLDVASTATTILAAQASKAAWLARRRGRPPAEVETSSLDGALMFVAHHLAIATSGDPLTPSDDGPGPPFPTADGLWVEFEVLTPAAWSALWERLGVQRSVSTGAWSAFVLRYLAGSCALPAALHAATLRHDLAQVRAAARDAGVELCELRGYDELPAAMSTMAPWTLRPAARPAAAAGESPADADAGGPLGGVRVVELATRLQGPLAGHLLGLLGATVVKVEPPGGDIGRRARSGFGHAAYRAYNEGKHVVEIDVKQPAGRAELHELAADADVFLHNAPLGRAERLGFAFDDLSAVNPRLVYAHASGWGAAGPTRIAGDFLVQAGAGCAHGLTPAGRQPLPSRVTILDVTGGLLACDAILAGLCVRERDGRAYAAQTSLLAAACMLQRDLLRAIAAGREVGRLRGRPLWGALDEPLATSDGWIALDARGARPRRSLARALALPDDASEDDVARRLARLAADDALQLARSAGIEGAVACDDLRALCEDPDVAARVRRLDDGCRVLAAPWRFG